MSKFCPYCGSACMDDDMFCGSCGANISAFQDAPAAPAAPSYPAAQYSAVRTAPKAVPANANQAVKTAANTVMKYIWFILIGMAIFTLVLGIMNFTAGHEVNVTATGSYGGETQRETQSMVLSEIYEEEMFIPLAISGLAYGLYNIVLTVMAAIMILKIFQGNRKIHGMLGLYSKMGAIGSVVYLVLVWITGTYSETTWGITMKATVHPHFTVWVSIILFGVLLAASLLSTQKKGRQ